METLTGAVDPTPPSNGCDLILILDFGSQYTHLLTRRLRPLCISSTSPLSYIASLNPRGIILSGGPHSVNAAGSPSLPDGFFAYVRSNGIHVLGICYGLQLLVQELGGAVKVGDAREYGRMEIFVERVGGLFGADGGATAGLDEVAHLPKGFHVAARSGQGAVAVAVAVAAIEWRERRLYGLLYHPTVTHSPKGMETLSIFLFNICGVTANWKMQDVIQEQIKVIRDMVGPEDHVICAFSGGVASTVAATLVHRAIGNRLHCVFIENGLLR